MLDDVAPWSATTAVKRPPPATRSFLKQPPQSKSRVKHRPEDDIEVRTSTQIESQISEDLVPRLAANTLQQIENQRTSLDDLPPEIQEGIIEYTHGILGSAASDGSCSGHGVRNWSMAMRHPRRKQLSDLALVSKTWRRLVQQRLYRHSE